VVAVVFEDRQLTYRQLNVQANRLAHRLIKLGVGPEKLVGLCLEHGHSEGSCYAYVGFGRIAGSHFGNYADGFRFGKLGCDLAEKQGLDRYQARTIMEFATQIIPWSRHIKTALELHRRSAVAVLIGFSVTQHHFVARRPGIVKAYSLLLLVPM
jgi:acyl-CoA synthetase (AMP-forming)/AMP-acid ligase II